MSNSSRLLGRVLKPALSYMSRNRLPQVDGRLTLSQLKAPVDIYRDSWGVPHIYAQNRYDLFLTQGYAQAQDRFWQMEVNRRAASGELSAMLGPLALPTDRLTRTLGFKQIAEQSWSTLPASMQSAVTAFTVGVNAFIEQRKWPVEFSLVRHEPQRWTEIDSLAFARLQLWALSYGYAGELARAQLTERVGATAAAELEPAYPEESPVALPAGIEFNGLKLENLLDAAKEPFIGRDMEGGGRGSNGWVIAPARSATGMPILCNDMHLPVTTPSIWYQIHLHSADGFHVCGLSQPGMPYVLVGHNEKIAWGATLAFADVEDIFVERLELSEGSETGRYAIGDDWEQLETRNETIEIRGQKPHHEIVYIGRHGPLIGRLLRDESRLNLTQQPADELFNLGLALQSSALNPNHQMAGFSLLNEANDWSDFTRAVAQIECPPLNLIYADTVGNIGYYMSGKVPIRQHGSGQLPVSGWDNEHEWSGYIPFSEMPHTFNPSCGYIVTCNHKVIADDYPHFLGSLWVNGYRAARLIAQIEASEKLTIADCARMQLDFHCAPGLEMAEAITSFELTDTRALACQNLLRDWNGWLDVDSIAGTVYQVFLQASAKLILEPHLGKTLLEEMLGTGLHETLAPITEYYGYWPDTLLRMLKNEDSYWLPGRLAKEAMVERALLATWNSLVNQLGADPKEWHWGRMHEVTFNHHLARQSPLDQVFSLGPFPIGGDTDTVTQTAIRPGEPYANNAFSVSNRHIFDLSDHSQSKGLIVPGQSGHLGGEHFADLIPYWLEGRHHPLLWTLEQVQTKAKSHLTITP